MANAEDQEAGFSAIFEEFSVPEERGALGGRSLVNNSGSVIRKVRVACCDVCGLRLGDNYLVCLECRRKVDPGCFVRFENRGMCTACLRTYLPLPKRAFLILGCVANGVTGRDAIHALTKIDSDEVKNLMQELVALGLVEKKGLSIFSSYFVTDSGMVAIGLLRFIYGKDADTRHFAGLLQDYLGHAGEGERKVNPTHVSLDEKAK